MKTLFSLFALACALVVIPSAKADSITFDSYSATNNTYTYEVTFNKSPTTFFLNGFSLTGLNGVTNAVVSDKLGQSFGVIFNSTSVLVGTVYTIETGLQVPFSVGTLTVYSLTAPGVANYALHDGNGLFKGSVEGPATSPVPEPSTLLMLGTGLIGAAGTLRRKFLS